MMSSSDQTAARWMVNLIILAGLVLALVQLTGMARANSLDSLTGAQLNAALDEIETGLPNGQRYSDAPKAAARSAWQVVQRHCPDRTEGQARDIVKTWIKNSVLMVEDYDDPIERKSRKGLRVNNGKRPS